MPNEVNPKGTGGRVVLDLHTVSPSADLIVDAEQRAKEFILYCRAHPNRLPAVVSAIEKFRLDSRLKEVASKELARIVPGLNALAAARISEITQIDLAFRRQASQIAATVASLNSVINNRVAETLRVAENLSLRIREYSRSIRIAIPPPDPLLSDIMGAMDKDPSAVKRLARRISWQPNPWHRECIRIKSRVEGSSPDEVRKKALIQGVILALGWEKRTRCPSK